MIAKIQGILTGIEKDTALVEINGITYGIFVTAAVSERLTTSGKIGQDVVFHTLEYIEGNPVMGNLVPRLVGFPNKTDLDFFSMLTTVQGLGVKRALRALTVPVKDVARAIELNDVASLKKLPEIGGKTAQKIIVELKGKTARFALLREDDVDATAQSVRIEDELHSDALEILRQLQYSESEAETLINETLKNRPDLITAEDLIQDIFKRKMG
ncbi:MAG: hypothetical protein JXB48_13505 [Candidatus Latescibacteria bacterium]|nr:hypothetical protein [Candidatus Latescibacterota bacterium]